MVGDPGSGTSGKMELALDPDPCRDRWWRQAQEYRNIKDTESREYFTYKK
jgi:hypothetical protein